ncbi:MAG TPA: hypothetical protein VIY53_19800 [Acidobacteriaceae bacterium]
MSQSQDPIRSEQHPTVTEHPEQLRQEKTGREDPAEVRDVGRPSSSDTKPEKTRKENAA